MLIEIIKFEFLYRAKRIDTYVYFVVLTMCSIVGVDFIYEGNLGNIKTNAPYVIATTMTILSAFYMMVASMIMGTSILRDYEYKVESLYFISPIKKWEYFFGRFLGSFIVLLLVFSGMLLGSMLGELMPWRDPGDLLLFEYWNYAKPFITLVIPTLIFSSALFFVSGALSHKLIVVYTQGILLLMVYIISMLLSRGMDNQFLSTLLDPFSFRTINYLIEYWTPIERNLLQVPLTGVLLYNRLLWLTVGLLIIAFGYYRFEFNVVRSNFKTKRQQREKSPSKLLLENNLVINHSKFKFSSITIREGQNVQIIRFVHLFLFYFKSILKEPSFWTIVISGMVIVFVNSINLGTYFGVDSYPTTYLIIEEMKELTIFFFLIILVFFSGELVWMERDKKIDSLMDALPTNDFFGLLGKLMALVMIYVLLFISIIIAGVVFQTLSGYNQYEFDVYFIGFFVGELPYLFLFTIVSIFFQVMSNHKYLGHLILVVSFLGIGILKPFGIDHVIYAFGAGDLGKYSAMNGFGHFIIPYLWMRTYWLSFSVVLFIVSVLFSIRGIDTDMKMRWRNAKLRLNEPIVKLGMLAGVIFFLSGSYIFYNTNILNDFSFSFTENEYRANYEKTLLQYKYLPQPKITDINLRVELYPEKRNYTAEGLYVLVNRDTASICEIHIQELPNQNIVVEYLNFDVGSTVDARYDEYRYLIYMLDEPLYPGDSTIMNFKQTYTTEGFVQNSRTDIVYNGTFLKNDHLITLGYNNKFELRSDDHRADYNLSPRIKFAKRDDVQEVTNAKSGDDGYRINFEIIIGTDSSQTAVAPGVLQEKWNKDERSYFHYKTDQPIINMYSIVSARYMLHRDNWKPSNCTLGEPIDLEIYYHEGHDYNIDRMMEGMKNSFDYYSKAFSAYQYDHMRILEFPRYQSYAQSFPGMIPFSESLGFILDIDDATDVDMAFFVTAHEVAHQWWGLQLVAANVEGRHMILESLAQYSAMMVMKEVYPEDKVHQLLQREMDRYLAGRSQNIKSEMPLAQVKGQKYIHYGKGSVNLYALQDYIGEERVNLALKKFLNDWNSVDGPSQSDRYATTYDLIEYFREVTPESLQYVIEDLFETITIYDNEIIEAKYKKIGQGQFKVNMTVNVNKYRIDTTGKEESVAVNDWIDIGIYTNGINNKNSLIYLKKHQLIRQDTVLEIMVDGRPTSVGIDPLHRLIDRNGENNLIDVTEH